MTRLGFYLCVESRLFQMPHAYDYYFFMYFFFIYIHLFCTYLRSVRMNEIDKQLPSHIIAYLCNENQILNT